MFEYEGDTPPPFDELENPPSIEELGYKKIDPYVDITGFEYVRGDSSVLTGLMQKGMFEAILRDPMIGDEAWDMIEDEFSELTEEAQEKLADALMIDTNKDIIVDFIEQVNEDTKNGKYHPLLSCRAPSIKTAEDLYSEYKQPPIGARAGKFTHTFFDDVNIQGGDNVAYVYVNSTGYNHSGKKLPEDTNVIGVVEGMKPPTAKITCKECNHNWNLQEFGTKIQMYNECPECGHSRDNSYPEDPFDIDGCFADWDKIAKKNVKKKSEKLFGHLGWSDSLKNMGDQDSFGTFA